MGGEPMTTSEDHDRVMAIPSYLDWYYEKRDDWMFRWQQRRRAQASKRLAKAAERYEAERRKIDEWLHGPEGRIEDLAFEAWSAENDRRYWKLRRV